jgi:Fe-S cluster assembly iron-binding protein IscA
MTLSDAARKRLLKLLPKESVGFEVQGYVGTCRGSTPVLKPVFHPPLHLEHITTSGLEFFVSADIAEFIRDCDIDYDPSFLGKGLTMTRSHQNGCACHQ